MVWFYTDMELSRASWEQLFCNSDLARISKATNVTIHFGNKYANGVNIQRYNKVGKHD